MKTKATLELVRQAHNDLKRLGHWPSADRIISMIGGGSKRTVIEHIRTIAEQDARAGTNGDIPVEMLSRSANAMVVKIWQEASRMAESAHAGKVEAMLHTQAGLFEELQAAYAAEEATRAELDKSRARVTALEAQLRSGVSAEEHLAALAEMLRPNQKSTRPPIVQFLHLLQAHGPRSKDAVFEKMTELGHTIKQARTARDHALKYGYVTEQASPSGGVELSITPTGIEKHSLEHSADN